MNTDRIQAAKDWLNFDEYDDSADRTYMAVAAVANALIAIAEQGQRREDGEARKTAAMRSFPSF